MEPPPGEGGNSTSNADASGGGGCGAGDAMDTTDDFANDASSPPDQQAMNGATSNNDKGDKDMSSPAADTGGGGNDLDEPSSSARTDTGSGTRQRQRQSASSSDAYAADWGGSRVLSQTDEDTLFVAEFLGQFWHVFAPPPRRQQQPAAAPAEEPTSTNSTGAATETPAKPPAAAPAAEESAAAQMAVDAGLAENRDQSAPPSKETPGVTAAAGKEDEQPADTSSAAPADNSVAENKEGEGGYTTSTANAGTGRLSSDNPSTPAQQTGDKGDEGGRGGGGGGGGGGDTSKEGDGDGDEVTGGEPKQQQQQQQKPAPDASSQEQILRRPKITPKLVQDAALLLAKREKELYRVGADASAKKSVADTAADTTAAAAVDGATTDGEANTAAADGASVLVEEEYDVAAAREIEQMLLRLGILGTKSLAEELLVVRPPAPSMSPADAAASFRGQAYTSKKRGRKPAHFNDSIMSEDVLFSALLNLPGSSHFRDLLGPVELDDAPGQQSSAQSSSRVVGVDNPIYLDSTGLNSCQCGGTNRCSEASKCPCHLFGRKCQPDLCGCVGCQNPLGKVAAIIGGRKSPTSHANASALDDSDYQCALPLSPNMLTYRSYLRLSLMTSCLPSADDVYQACKSPLCAFLPSLSMGTGLKPTRGVENTHHKKDSDNGKESGGKRASPSAPKLDRDSSHGQQSVGWAWTRTVEAAMLSESASLTGSDIVALWIRAQRNTGAWRQLLGMFHFVDITSPLGGEDMEVDGGDSMDLNLAPNYRAVYVGNHRNASKRVDEESKKVDSLITWAATNQVLFTWSRIRKELEGGLFPQLEGADTPTGGKSKKRKHSSGKGKGKQDKGGKKAKRALGETASSPTSPKWILSYYKPQLSLPTSSRRMLPRGVLVALQSFALRLLCTMHRPILTVLYTKEPRTFLVAGDSSSSSQRLLSALIDQGIPDKVKNEMRKWRTGTSDRTLARIDRRCFGSKYIPDGNEENDLNHEDVHLSFYQLVKGLLEAVLHSLPADAETPLASIAAAISDWALIRVRYLTRLQTENGGMESLSTLIGDEASVDKLPALLSTLPAPWGPDKCNVCKEELPRVGLLADKGASLRACSCCNKSTHLKCSPDDKETVRSLSALLASYDPLRSIYSLRSPEYLLSVPDYSEPPLRDTIKWSRHVVAVKRTLVQGNRPPSWGMTINHLESGSVALDDILGGLFDSSTIQGAELSKKMVSSIPVRLPLPNDLASDDDEKSSGIFKALLVGGVSPGGVAEVCGVKKGDVVVAIDIGLNENASNGDRGTSYPIGDRHDLTKYTKEQRISLFKRENVSELRLHIYRSEDIDLVQKGEEFFALAKKMSSAVTGLFCSNKMKAILADQRWYCSDCQLGRDSAASSAGEKQSRSIFHGALCCRSVIRRLAVEWYSRPFLDEREDHNQKIRATNRSHEYHVSLRRLDGMFCAIMDKNSSGNDAVGARGATDLGDSEVSPFFFVPPWSASDRTRLSWAPVEMEKDPFRLLCKGMELLLTSPSVFFVSDSLHEQRRELARHFLPLFSSYCLDSSVDWASAQASGADGDSSSALVRGPPESIIRLCPPFLQEPCNCCGVIASQGVGDALEGYCSQQCRRAFSDGWLVDNIPSESVDSTPEIPQTKEVSTEATKEVNTGATSGAKTVRQAEIKCQKYDINSSLVGSTILALPGDPLLDLLWEKLQIEHDHFHRPVELVVASFLPFDFIGVDGLHEHGVYGDPLTKRQNRRGNAKSGKKSFLTRPDIVDGGIFQLIPILNSHQLKFVLERCKLRNPSASKRSSTRAAKEMWTDVEALQLHGIIHLSANEIYHRLKITQALCSAMDSAVANLATGFGSQDIRLRNGTSTAANQEVMLSSEDETNPLGRAGIVDESPRAATSKALLHEPSDAVAPGFVHALCTLGESECNMDNSLPNIAKARLGEYTFLADAMANAGVYMVREAFRNKPQIDTADSLRDERMVELDVVSIDGDTDVEGGARGGLRIARKRRKSIETTPASSAVVAADGPGTLSHTSGHTDLLDPTPFETSNEYTVCYSDLILFKADMKRAGGGGKGGSLAKRLAMEREKAKQLEQSNELSLQRPTQFATFTEMELSRFPLASKPFQPPSDAGGRFDVILHRLKPEGAINGAQENSDDEWTPDREGGEGIDDSKRTSSSSSSTQFKGRGWGLELVRWRKDRGQTLRIGRVFPSSPAAKAGLHPNDIVIAINGRSVEAIKTDDALAREMLGSSRHSSNGCAAVDILSKAKSVTGPTSLQLLRVVPKKPSQRRSRSGASGRGIQHAVAQAVGPQPLAPRPPLQRLELQHLDQEVQRVQQEAAREEAARLEAARQQQQAPVISERRPLAFSDLYKQGSPQSVLTRAETAVFAEAVEQQQPKLGFRLLLPRYPTMILKNEYHSTMMAVMRNLYQWPKLSPAHWQKIIEADYQRSTKETGPIVEIEGNWSYKKPTAVLPLDRLLEGFMKEEREEQKREQQRLQEAYRQEEARRQQQEAARRQLAKQQAQQAEKALAAIEAQKRQLEEEAAAQARMLAQAQQVVQQDAQPQMRVFAPPRHASYSPVPSRQGQVQEFAPPSHGHGAGPMRAVNNPIQGQRGVIDLCDDNEGGDGGAGAVSTYDPAGSNDLERIRGGGDGHDGSNGDDAQRDAVVDVDVDASDTNGFPLLQIPRADWKGYVVVGPCCSMRRGQGGEMERGVTSFLGVVDESVPPSPSPPETEHVSVIVLFVFKQNLFLPADRVGVHKVNACQLFAAFEGSAEQGVYSDWVAKFQKDLGGKFYPSPVNNNTNEDIHDAGEGGQFSDPEEVIEVATCGDVEDARIPHSGEVEDGGESGEVEVEVVEDGAGGEVQAVDQDAYSQRASLDDTTPPSSTMRPAPRDQRKISLRTAAMLLVKRLSQRASSLLGYLPDGRAVIWLQSDPEAIYLRSADTEAIDPDSECVKQLEYVGIVRRGAKEEGGLIIPASDESNLCCVWGCNKPCQNEDEGRGVRQVLSFATQEELASHMVADHSYIGGDEEANEDGKKLLAGDCVRLSGGANIIKLCSDLTTASCARCPALAKETKSFDLPERGASSHSIIFDFEEGLDLSVAGRGAIAASTIAKTTDGRLEVRSMMRLCSRLCRLFAIEKNGKYRLSLPAIEEDHVALLKGGSIAANQEQEDPALSGDDAEEVELLSSIQCDIDAAKSPIPHQGPSTARDQKFIPKGKLDAGCICATLDSNAFSSVAERANCPLCFANEEQIVESISQFPQQHENASATPTGTPTSLSEQPTKRRGIGCALISDFAPETSSSRRKIVRDAKMLQEINDLAGEESGQLETLKAMLLQIARRVPPSLYIDHAVAAAANEDVDFTNVMLWDEVNLQQWCGFVKKAANERMLSLAFVLLIASVNKNKMPNWWKARKAGWSSACMSLQGQTMSSLAMNFYIFDAALVDAVPSSSDGGRTASREKRPSKKKRKAPPPKSSSISTSNKYFERLQKMGVVKRMTTAVKWAKECGILPWEQDYSDRCITCQEAGNLLCCEYCSQAQHIECFCLDVRGDSKDIPFDDIPYVCVQCMLDMSLLYQELMEG